MESAKRAPHGLAYGILTVTHEQLNTILCHITLPDELPNQEYLDRVIDRQISLAREFREFMTRDQSFESVNGDRQTFYESVIEAAETVSFSLLHLFVIVTYLSSSTNMFFNDKIYCSIP